MKQLKALQILHTSGKKAFTSADLQKILQTNSARYAYVLVGRLAKAGVLEKVAKGYYLLASQRPLDFELANLLYRPSYISLESALNFYGIMVQSPQQVTSVTTKLTKKIMSGSKLFSYMHINQKHFSDYQSVDGFLIATPEKALIDTMYATALGRSSLAIEELNLQSVDKTKVRELASRNTNRAFQHYFTSLKF